MCGFCRSVCLFGVPHAPCLEVQLDCAKPAPTSHPSGLVALARCFMAFGGVGFCVSVCVFVVAMTTPAVPLDWARVARHVPLLVLAGRRYCHAP